MESIWKRRKRLILIGVGALVLILAFALGLWLALGHRSGEEEHKVYEFSLSERDIAIDIGSTVKLAIIPEQGSEELEPEITWISGTDAVATVDEDGTVTAVTGGESRVTAIARCDGNEYSVSCMVTVKAPGKEYSNYKIRWFTQNKNRVGYDVTEEEFERLVGSQVELTEKEARRKLPKNYVLNTEKGSFTGTVKEKLGQCILEVYFDVAEINYYVDCYYESETEFGTYPIKETETYKAYAYTEVSAPASPKEGFLRKEGAGNQSRTVEAGFRMSVYYDRVRSKATITYASGRPTAVYTNVYGVGLVDAPADALTDSLERYSTTSGCYINGNRVDSIEEELKKIARDVQVEVRLEDFSGWICEPDGTMQNMTEYPNQEAYAYLKGSGNTVYLSATYDLTGSQTQMVGVTVRCGGSNRNFRFNDHAVRIHEGFTGESGIVDNGWWGFNDAGYWAFDDGEAYVWNQNNAEDAYGTKFSSASVDMYSNTEPSSHDMVWAIQEGVIYCNLDGVPVLRIPLSRLDKEWTAEKEYEIGIYAFDGEHAYNDLKVRNISVSFDKEAEARLKLDGEAEDASLTRVAYDVITGKYLPASAYGFSTLSTKAEKGNTGISADINLLDVNNSASAYGVTVGIGDRSVQYVLNGNDQRRRHDDYGWESMAYLRAVDQVKIYDDGGVSHVEAFVEDGYFYVKYNGVQVQCINMLSMFPEYDPEVSEVTVGVCSTDAVLGLAEICNVRFLSEQDVTAIEKRQWNVYSEWDGSGPAEDKCSFEEGYFEKTNTNGWTTMPLYGSSKAWQVEGTMARTDARDAEMLKMGFRIEAGGKEIRILGQNYGILPILNSGWPWVWGYNEGVNDYVLNTKASCLFHERTADEITFKAVIYEDVLYVWFDGDLCWCVPLTNHKFKLEDGSDYNFEPGSDYRLTLVLYDGSGLGKMTDLKVQMGYQVEAPVWVDARRMTYDAAKNAYVVGDGQESWLYSKAAAGNIGVSADVAAPGKNAGITVRVGNESWLILSDGEENYVRIKNYQWDGNAGTFGSFSNTPLRDADGNGNIKGLVKDGYFYLLFNDKEVLCMNMLSLFPDYNEDSFVSIGLGSWWSPGVSFSNAKYLSSEEVTAVETKQWGYYSDYPGADSYSFEEGYFEKKNADGWKIMPMLGSSKVWQVEGTMARTDARDAEMLKMGFRIESGDKEIRILGQNYGILPIINNGWPWVWGYNEGVNDYVLNTKASSLFHERTADEITFKAVIYEDVLYVWFDGDLCWRVPLTNNQINGGYNFAPGSDYRLTLVLYDGSGLGKMKDLKVQMGYQVETPVWVDVRNMTYDAAKNDYIVGGGQESWLYSQAAAGNISVSADVTALDKNAGIAVRVGNESWLILSDGEENDVRIKNHQEVIGTGSNFNATPLRDAQGKGKIEGQVKDGYFYLLFNDKEVLCIDMASLFPDYNEDSLVSMGFGGWWSEGVSFSNVKMEYLVEELDWVDVRNMTYDAEKNSYVVGYGQESWLYSKAAVGNIGVSADVDTLSTRGNAGIVVRVGNVSWLILSDGEENYVRIKNHQWDGSAGTFGSFSNTPLRDAQGKGKIEGRVKDGYFYLLFNDKEVLCIDMASLFPGYNEDSLVSMGFGGWWSEGVSFSNVEYMSAEEADMNDKMGYQAEAPEALAAVGRNGKILKFGMGIAQIICKKIGGC